MRRSPVALIPLVGLLFLGACTGRDSTAPRGIAPDQSNLAVAPADPATTCDANATKKAAGDYFTSNQDPVYGYLNDFFNAYKSGGAPAATPYGWAVLGQVVSGRLTSATTDGSYGRVFVIDVFRCMADLSTSPATVPLGIPQKFYDSTAIILNSGIFDIRTGGSTGGPALGKVEEQGVRSFGYPGWGVETSTSSSFWPGTTANPTVKYAVYGYPTTVGNTPLLNSPRNINTNDDIQYSSPFNAFELGTVPSLSSLPGLREGVCYPANTNANDGTVERLVHNNSEILALDPPNQMCPTSNLVASAAAAPSWYAILMNHATTFLTPKPLFAKVTDEFDLGGGSASGWSPFQTGTLSASNILLTIIQQPKNSVVGATNSLVVKATYLTTPVPQVSIDSVVVYNNSGTPAGAIVTSSNLPLLTANNGTAAVGTATVTFAIGKAGGYLVTVWGSLDDVPVSPVTSTQFQVKKQ